MTTIFDKMTSLNIVSILAAVVPLMLAAEPVPQHTSVRTGAIYYAETMESENIHGFRDIARMDKETFIRLLELLKAKTTARDSEHVSLGEKVMLCKPDR